MLSTANREKNSISFHNAISLLLQSSIATASLRAMSTVVLSFRIELRATDYAPAETLLEEFDWESLDKVKQRFGNLKNIVLRDIGYGMRWAKTGYRECIEKRLGDETRKALRWVS